VGSSTAGRSPLIEVVAAEEELAPRTVLLGRDRALSSQLPERVAVDPEIVGGGPRVQPLGEQIDSPGVEPLSESSSNPIRKLINEHVDQVATAVDGESRLELGSCVWRLSYSGERALRK